MGETFSVDDNLKSRPDDQYYVFWAIQHNNYPAFREAIKKEKFKSDPNIVYSGEGKKTEWKFTPLIHAVYENRIKMVNDLIGTFYDTIKVNYKCKNDHEWTALHWAIEKNNSLIVDILLKHDKVNHNTIYDNKGRSAADLSEDRQYWNINMKFILRDLTEARQSIVKKEQTRHESEDAIALYIKELLSDNKTYDSYEIKIFKKILTDICVKCIKYRKPIDSTLYIIAYEISNNYEKNQFCDMILNECNNILDNNKSNKLQNAWFKKYLIPCCIWQKKYYDKWDKPSENESNLSEIEKLKKENEKLKNVITQLNKSNNLNINLETLLKNDKNTEKKTIKKEEKKEEIIEVLNSDEFLIINKNNEESVKNGKLVWDEWMKVFNNKQPEYGKELMYFSRRKDNIPTLTLKQAQDTYLKYGKGGFVYITEEEEKKRKEESIQRKFMYEKLLNITLHHEGNERKILKSKLLKYTNNKNNDIKLLKSIKDYKTKSKMIIRQDSLDTTENDANKQEMQQLSNIEKGFDATAYYTRNIYTNKLLLLSNGLNDAYQNTISFIFENVYPNKSLVKVYSGPIKKQSRIIEKSETKYKRQKFPVSAKVLDTLRCSVVFKEPKDLYEGINWFINYIDNNSNQEKKENIDDTNVKLGNYSGVRGEITKILRSKNMFTDREVNWDINNPNYADIKFNVVFKFEDKQIICEIQFLISLMMETKHKIHGFYSILRYKDIFSALNQNITSITPQRRFSSLVRDRINFNINEIKDLMITFGFHGSNILIDNNWQRYGLHFAAEYKLYDLMKLFLLVSDVNVNIKDRFGQTPLNQACYANDIKIIKMLLNHKSINVNQLNNEGQQAIHFHHPGNGYKNIEILKLLLNAGCNPCLQDKSEHKMNTLHRLLSDSKNNQFIENVKEIINVKSNYCYKKNDVIKALKIKDAKDKTVLDYAKENDNQMIDQLLQQYIKN